MKVDFTQVIRLMDGDAIPWPEKNTTRDATLKDFAMNAVLGVQDGAAKDPKTKYDRYLLATKIRLNQEVTVDELATIKTCIGEAYPPASMGPCWDIIESAGKSGKPDGNSEPASKVDGVTDPDPEAPTT